MRKTLLLILLASFFSISFADIGPKPSVYFRIKFDGGAVQDETFYAAMLGCYGNDSYDIEHLSNNTHIRPILRISEYDASKGCTWVPSWLAWGGECSNSRCFFDYFPPEDFRLAVYIPSINRTFITNEAVRSGYNDGFDVLLFSDGRAEIGKVSTIGGGFTGDALWYFISAFVVTITVELALSFLYIRSRKLKQTILISVAIANILSVTFLWLLFPFFQTLLSFLCCIPFIVAEGAVVIFEFFVIYLMNRKNIKPRDAFAMSLINNVATSLIWAYLLMAASLMSFL